MWMWVPGTRKAGTSSAIHRKREQRPSVPWAPADPVGLETRRGAGSVSASRGASSSTEDLQETHESEQDGEKDTPLMSNNITYYTVKLSPPLEPGAANQMYPINRSAATMHSTFDQHLSLFVLLFMQLHCKYHHFRQ